MNRSIFFVAIVVFLFPNFATAREVLSIGQIEEVIGIFGLSAKPSKYDKVATAYVTAKKESVLTLKLASAAVYDVWKSQPPMDDQLPLDKLGDDAIISQKGRYVCFKQADASVCVIGMRALPGKPALVSDAKLLELARLASSSL